MNLIDFGRKKWDYLLKADFSGANSGAISNGVSVEAASSGSVQAGTLTVVDPGAGSVEVLSGSLKIIGNGVWGTGVIGGSVTRSIGLPILGDLQYSAADTVGKWMLGFNNSNGISTAAPWESAYIYVTSAETIRALFNDGGATRTPGNVDQPAATIYGAALILGGFDAGGVPYKIGDAKADFDYGAAAFYNDGTNWLLLYRHQKGNDSTLYPTVQNQNDYCTVDNLAIPNVDLSHLLQPLVLDTFTGADNTAVDARSPDVDIVGDGWVVDSGDWDLEGGKLRQETSALGSYVVRKDCGKADIFLRTVVTPPSTTNFAMNVGFRRVDADNHWSMQIQVATDIAIREKLSGGTTTRATNSYRPTRTAQRITISAIGSVVSAWVDDAGSTLLTYASAATDPAATQCYFSEYRNGDNPGTYENFAVYPIGTSGEYSELNRYK